MTPKPENAVFLENVTVEFVRWGNRVKALNGVNASIPCGAWTLVVGPNGSGKSSLLRMIAGLLHAHSGTVEIYGEPASGMSRRRRTKLVAFVQQRPEECLAASLTIREHAALCNLSASGLQDWLERMGLCQTVPFVARAWARPVDSLSGGERQLLGILLQLMRDTPVVLLDEAFSALDPEREQILFKAVGRLAAERTVIQVTHQPERFRDVATQTLALQDGRILTRAKESHAG